MGTDSIFLVNFTISGISKDCFQIFLKITLETIRKNYSLIIFLTYGDIILFNCTFIFSEYFFYNRAFYNRVLSFFVTYVHNYILVCNSGLTGRPIFIREF